MIAASSKYYLNEQPKIITYSHNRSRFCAYTVMEAMYSTACVCPTAIRLFLSNLAVHMGHIFFNMLKMMENWRMFIALYGYATYNKSGSRGDFGTTNIKTAPSVWMELSDYA